MASNTNYFAMEDDYNEFEMWQGLRGPYFQPHVADDGTLTWTNNGGLPNPDPITIEGHDGAPGFSPTVEIQQIQGGHRVIITDEDGPHSFDVIDYMEGRAIQSTVLNADYTLTIRYTDGTSYTTPSIRGATGATGPAGTDGTDGVSPDVTITTITGGHRVTITDADHPQGQSFDVMDGSSQGGLPAGGGTMDFLRKSSNADYAAEWVSLYSGETPLMDSGSGDPGLSSLLSRRDHRHPTDTSRQATITASGILKGNGSGGVSAAVAGTDYLTRATNYSPVRLITATPYNISADDIGATVSCGYGMRNTPITVNLTQAVSTTLPIGTEIAILNYFDSDITIAVSGIQVGVSGIDGGGPTKLFYSSTSHSFKPGDIYSMLALKKISSDATYGDCWLLTGNVEVVT